MLLITMKIVFLFLAVWWSSVNVGRVIYKQKVPAINVFIMAIGIVGFVTIQFGLYK